METFSALLAICAGNSPVPGEFRAQRPVTRSFDVFFDLRLNKRLSKQSWGWWFETLSRPLWRHRTDVQKYQSTWAMSHNQSYIIIFNALSEDYTKESHHFVVSWCDIYDKLSWNQIYSLHKVNEKWNYNKVIWRSISITGTSRWHFSYLNSRRASSPLPTISHELFSKSLIDKKNHAQLRHQHLTMLGHEHTQW